MNKLKLWLSRNAFKILVIGIIILIFYLTLKSMDIYYDNIAKVATTNESNKNEIIEQNNSINSNQTNITEEKSTSLFEEISTTSSEYQKVTNAVQKLLTAMCNSNTESGVIQDVYNMFSEELYNSIFDTNGIATVYGNSMLNYIANMEDVNRYSIDKVCKFSENNNVIRYVVDQVYSDPNSDKKMTIYMIINVDYNNNTFSYDGNVAALKDVKDKVITAINNKESNLLE